VALLTTAVVTVLLVATFDSAIQTNWKASTYLVPSMLTFAVPLGLLVGTAWTLQGASRTRKLAAGCVTGAALCSMAMYVNVAWLTPESNQTFREHAFEQNYGPLEVSVERGLHELTMPALRDRIEQELATGHPHRAHVAELVFYQRYVVAVAMLPMVGVILALTLRRKWTRGWLTAAALVTFSVYYAMLTASQAVSESFAIPPIVTVWAGPVLITGTALLLTLRRPRARA
jgi:lipopolysaccharide export LptBFGC system permease protein LptF